MFLHLLTYINAHTLQPLDMDQERILTQGLFVGWDDKTVMPVAVQAAGGLCVGQVDSMPTKYMYQKNNVRVITCVRTHDEFGTFCQLM